MSVPIRVPQALTRERCESLVELSEQQGFEIGQTGSNGAMVGRSNAVAWIEHTKPVLDVYARVVALFAEFAQAFGVELTEMELLQVASYGPGDYYAMHRDICEEPGISKRRLSMSIELSGVGDYDGGKLCFPSFDLPGQPEVGSAVIFLPCWRHEVQPVMKGTRYSLVAWAA